MDMPHIYEIRVEGQLNGLWKDWFDGLTVQQDKDEATLLTGTLPDQAALLGVLTKIHSLNLILISVFRQPNANTIPTVLMEK